MKYPSIVATALATLLAVPAAHADWQGKGEFGLVMSRGNSDTDTINTKVDVASEIDRWTHSAGLSALRATNAGSKTADRYELRGQSNYKLSERSFAFGSLRYEDDAFSPYNYQATAAVGYGYKFIDTETTRLSGGVGVGYRRLEPILTGTATGNAIARGDLNLEHRFNAATRLINRFLVESGKDNTFLQNELAVEVKMSDRLALSVGYALRHNTDAPAPLKKTDQLTTANIVFAF